MGSSRVRIEQRVAAVSPAVPNIAADIKSRPIVGPDCRRLERHNTGTIRCQTSRHEKKARGSSDAGKSLVESLAQG